MVRLSRILIFAEAVTLAHVARPIALSRILREQGHEVCIAAAPAAQRWVQSENVARQPIGSIEPTDFLRALARGMPAYGTTTLKQYVEDDLRAIAAWHPDIVIGDFRLSLHISARACRKALRRDCQRVLVAAVLDGRGSAGGAARCRGFHDRSPTPAFRAVYPAAFALHALPFHRACKWFGVDSPGRDIRDVYTASDSTGFADVEAFYEPTPGAPDAPVFIGPLAWEPPGIEPLPDIPGRAADRIRFAREFRIGAGAGSYARCDRGAAGALHGRDRRKRQRASAARQLRAFR